MLTSKPLIAVSACLLGRRVRYDGNHKYTPLIAEQLSRFCQLIEICPEFEMGLGVPRDKIQLTQLTNEIKVLTTDSHQMDVSQLMIGCAKRFAHQYPNLIGLVLQDHSPSCGIDNVALFSISGKKIGDGTGLFAKTIITLLPNIIHRQVSQLSTMDDIERFLEACIKRA